MWLWLLLLLLLLISESFGYLRSLEAVQRQCHRLMKRGGGSIFIVGIRLFSTFHHPSFILSLSDFNPLRTRKYVHLRNYNKTSGV